MIMINVASAYIHIYEKTPEGGLFGWWISNDVVHRSSDWHGYMLMFMIGYFVFDEITMHFVWADLYYKGDKVSQQMGLHHILGVIYMVSGLIVGYMMPIGMCIAFITEASTFFLNLRQMHERRDT